MFYVYVQIYLNNICITLGAELWFISKRLVRDVEEDCVLRIDWPRHADLQTLSE